MQVGLKQKKITEQPEIHIFEYDKIIAHVLLTNKLEVLVILTYRE